MKAPWRWRWGTILALMLLWTGVGWVLHGAPVLGIAVASWFVVWIRAGYSEPRSPTGAGTPSVSKEAGHSVVVLGGGAGRIVYVEAERVHVAVRVDTDV